MVVGWPTCATVLPTAGGGVSLRPASDTLAGFGQGVECPRNRGRSWPFCDVCGEAAPVDSRPGTIGRPYPSIDGPAVLASCGGLTDGMILAYSSRVLMIRAKRLSTRSVRSAAAGSWIALVAATTLGDAADAVRAKVRADGLSAGRVYRLVVQSYDRQPGENPGKYARPIGSVQRSVTADELRDGVHVSLVEFRQKIADGVAGDPLIMAWIDVGEPDLEFDGRMARPRAGSVYGVVKRSAGQDVVQISLNRKVAT